MVKRNKFCSATYLLFVVLLAIRSDGVFGEVFSLNQLPIGAEVTLGPPATTKLNLGQRVTLGPTDLPQSLKFTAVGSKPIKISIYDPNQKRVRHVQITPGVSFLYQLANLKHLQVVTAKAKNQKMSSLRIESNKPVLFRR